MKKMMKLFLVILFVVSLGACGKKEKKPDDKAFYIGTYGMKKEKEESFWGMTKYVFDEDGKVTVYVVGSRSEDGIDYMEYTFSAKYDYAYDEEDSTITFDDTVFEILNKEMVSEKLILVYESNKVEKPRYRVANASLNEMEMELNQENEWSIIGTGKNHATYLIASEFGGYPITAIKNGAFARASNMTEIIIPSNIKVIGKGVFNPSASLTIKFTSKTPCTQNGMLVKTSKVRIEVPEDSVAAYKKAWKNYSNIIFAAD